jgi:hypothetical protein
VARKDDGTIVGDAEDCEVLDLVEAAAQPYRIRGRRIVIAGQDHDRQPGIGDQAGRPLDRYVIDRVVVECVAGK